MDDNEALARLGPAFLDPYAVIDGDRRITNFNAAFGQILELRPAERRKLINSHCCESLKLEICKESCVALECMRKAAPLRMQEIRASTPTNTGMMVEINALPMKDAEGRVNATLLVYRDVSDER